jgi:hypothetical protein
MSNGIAVLFPLSIIGCPRSPHLVAGPIELKQLPVLIRFERPAESPLRLRGLRGGSRVE